MNGTGFKVTITEYSGDVTGDDEVWLNEDAARYYEVRAREHGIVVAYPEQNAEVKLEEVEFESISGADENLVAVGRIIHKLRRDTLNDVIRKYALFKLNDVEKKALGLNE